MYFLSPVYSLTSENNRGIFCIECRLNCSQTWDIQYHLHRLKCYWLETVTNTIMHRGVFCFNCRLKCCWLEKFTNTCFDCSWNVSDLIDNQFPESWVPCIVLPSPTVLFQSRHLPWNTPPTSSSTSTSQVALMMCACMHKQLLVQTVVIYPLFSPLLTVTTRTRTLVTPHPLLLNC